MILACPACDSRHDVTGHRAGQPLRCRCGAMMMLPAMAASAGELACPRCGAELEIERTRAGSLVDLLSSLLG